MEHVYRLKRITAREKDVACLYESINGFNLQVRLYKFGVDIPKMITIECPF